METTTWCSRRAKAGESLRNPFKPYAIVNEVSEETGSWSFWLEGMLENRGRMHVGRSPTPLFPPDVQP